MAADVWDAIVVGAGPAGCAAAYDLARSNKRVLLLDKSEFPRLKACAGGISHKALRALRYSIEPVTRQVVHRIVVESGEVRPVLYEKRAPLVTMTVRSEFDDYCLAKTRDAGAEFRKIGRLKDLVQADERVVVATDSETLQAKYVIGADGVHSAVRLFCRGAGSTSGGFAIEGRVPMPFPTKEMTIDLDGARNGYAWIFPKGDHLNVGIGYFSGSPGEMLNRERLATYVRHKLHIDVIDDVVGQYMGCRGWDGQNAFGRVLLAGDAAGVVDPLSGEGIYGAIVSGQVAAKAVETALAGKKPAAKAHQAGLGVLRKRLSISRRVAPAFYANPDRTVRAMNFPGVSMALMTPNANRLMDAAVRTLNWARRWRSA